MNGTIIVSIQGKQGAGMSQMSLQAIEPAILAVGGTIEKKRDEKSGVFLTVTVPADALAADGTQKVFGPDDVLAAKYAQPRIGFANFDRVCVLVMQRRELEGYGDGDMARTVARMALPKAFSDLARPEALIAQLRQDASAGIARIDAELQALGFDTGSAAAD
jgi:hypothetical protein